MLIEVGVEVFLIELHLVVDSDLYLSGPSFYSATQLGLAVRQMPNTEGYIEPGKKRAKKHIDVELCGLWGKDKVSPAQARGVCPAPASCCSIHCLIASHGCRALAKTATRLPRKLLL